MRILLVSPWNKGNTRFRSPLKALIDYPALALPQLKALVPPELDATVVIFDEISNKPMPSGFFDVVGISVITSTAARAYEYAHHFSAQGSFVVLGGCHPSFMPAVC